MAGCRRAVHSGPPSASRATSVGSNPAENVLPVPLVCKVRKGALNMRGARRDPVRLQAAASRAHVQTTVMVLPLSPRSLVAVPLSSGSLVVPPVPWMSCGATCVHFPVLQPSVALDGPATASAPPTSSAGCKTIFWSHVLHPPFPVCTLHTTAAAASREGRASVDGYLGTPITFDLRGAEVCGVASYSPEAPAHPALRETQSRTEPPTQPMSAALPSELTN